MVVAARILGDFVDGPGERRPHGLAQHRPAGFADGRQPTERPFLRTALPELVHEQTVRQHDQVHVPCLAPAVPQLTITHAKFLLAVSMESLRARPAMAIDLPDPTDFPGYPVGHED